MGRYVDGIVWLAIGVSLLGQAAFVFLVGWVADAGGTQFEPVLTQLASGIVGVAFLAAGVGALYLGVRRVREARPSTLDRGFPR